MLSMSATVEAIYEHGILRPLQPLALPEHAHVRICVETMDDPDRAAWLAESERRLRETWGNDADDAYNALLTQ